ncbi:hypothetical protein [Kribbella sindirgiensis]|uniref:Uncharacterized protein n=1 Tax=Kribbella sindirgiensis TaxID=1124744 RepID=A0A4R0I278_9ACTN|nr:hypothetical protein [Kribbella sindirgiensis]TCC19984.1 hypothetical protein E0H50_37820 [Kribbella sindirgiensis]
MKRIVVAASFTGDAHDHLRSLGVNPHQAIIVTPTSVRGLNGLRADWVETFWDIRRRGAFLGELDGMISRMVALYPDMDYRVVP